MEHHRSDPGAPLVDSLAKLEIAMRPQSVPSWLSSDTNHAPKVTALGPRRSAVEYMDSHKSPPNSALSSISESATATVTGPLASSVRPRAPIVLQKEATAQEKPFLAKESVLGIPKRNRHRARAASDSKSRRVTQSLTESLRSLEFFDKTNRSRELSAKYAVMQTQADPEGNVHFVNIDDDDDDDADVDAESCVIHEGVDDPHDSSLDFEARHTVLKPAMKARAPMTQQQQPPSPTTTTTVAAAPFRIPELPHGQHLVINILSTWGDPFYVGLMGVELFDHTGHAVHLSDVDKQLSADPPDLNALADHDRVDPRTVDKLVDGQYLTNDELHAWLAPFTRGQNHFIYMDLDYPLSLSMLRVWNYNTTRIHSYRGARYVEIALDGTCIFKGEIRRAPGSVTEDVEACHECILFTTSPSILRLIEKYEKHKQVDSAEVASKTDAPLTLERPKTGNRANRSAGVGAATNSTVSPAVFPLSSVPKPGKATALSLVGGGGGASRPCTAPIVCDAAGGDKPVTGQRVKLVCEANWGDPYDVGLAGLQFLDANYMPLKTDTTFVTANHAQSKAERLIKSHGARHESVSPDEMWIAPLHHASITVDFGHSVTLRALKVWNYNTTLEESFKGAKQLAVLVDGARIARFSLRKAPGHVMDFDFGQFLHLKLGGQTVNLTNPSHLSSPTPVSPPTSPITMATPDILAVHSPLKPDLQAADASTNRQSRWPPMKPIAEVFQQYQTPLFPTGYIVKFVFHSTWGDPFYLGLNGLELYDRENNLVALSDQMIDAQPRDINILKDPGAPHDVRTLDKLYDGVNNTYDDCHMWLAPFTPSQHNKLVLFFNEPVTLSRIRMWNYSKTPARGVKEFEVYLDDVLIFHGTLKIAPALQLTSEDEHEYEMMRLTTDVGENRRLRRRRYERAEAAAAAADMTQSILFTDDPAVAVAEANNIYLPDDELEESVTFYDNSQVLSLSDVPQRENLVRPTTSAGAMLPRMMPQQHVYR